MLPILKAAFAGPGPEPPAASINTAELLGSAKRVPRAARSVRRRLLSLPGRLTTHAGRWTLHLPARWPWQHDFVEALTRIRALPAAA